MSIRTPTNNRTNVMSPKTNLPTSKAWIFAADSICVGVFFTHRVVCVDVCPFFDEEHPPFSLKRTPSWHHDLQTCMARSLAPQNNDDATVHCSGRPSVLWKLQYIMQAVSNESAYVSSYYAIVLPIVVLECCYCWTVWEYFASSVRSELDTNPVQFGFKKASSYSHAIFRPPVTVVREDL